MTAKTSGDSTLGVSGIIFRAIQDSFTTQGLRTEMAPAATANRPAAASESDCHSRVNRRRLAGLKPCPANGVEGD
jgi:hypothetical protein